MAIEANLLRRRSALEWPHRPHVPGRADERERLTHLCGVGSRSHSGAERSGHYGQLICPQGQWRQRGNRSTRRQFILLHSPDVNEIEQAFPKLKALLRKAGVRTINDQWAIIASAIELFPPIVCTYFFVNSGYEIN